MAPKAKKEGEGWGWWGSMGGWWGRVQGSPGCGCTWGSGEGRAEAVWGLREGCSPVLGAGTWRWRERPAAAGPAQLSERGWDPHLGAGTLGVCWGVRELGEGMSAPVRWCGGGLVC